MHPITNERKALSTSPCDLLEEIFEANSWPFERYGENEILIDVNGDWCLYRLYFFWNDKRECFHASSRIGVRLPDYETSKYSSLLQLLNAQMNMGHIDISPLDGCPTWRLSVPLRGMGTISRETIEDIIEAALDECDHVYPAVQLFLFGKHTAEEAVRSALFETVGVA